MISFRLLGFCLLGFAMMLATGCAGKTGTAQPQGLSDVRPVADQAPAALSRPETPPDEPLDPFARADEGAGEEYDPWEPMNTKIFEFNRQVDRFVLKPVAKGYDFVMPDLVQVGISNIFSNLRFAPRFLNNVFQGKLKGAGIEVGRFLINSTVGVAGFFDLAKKVDLVTSEEDLGQTLGFYGVKPGPYLVL
ncbi:MAG TPA: VacJ family lipoprotein, partial [Nitrospiraceae bacterium]|nr:VacJ family lipoprotein [Nitrospiraceae bacterium]